MIQIPKIIHYCWFGGNAKPKRLKKYIDHWFNKLPDYEIIEWNESNCNLQDEIPYVQEAYRAKKFAFVSDYIRIKKLIEFGGVYLDTDVDILRRFDGVLENYNLVMSFQGVGNLGTAFIASVPHYPMLEALLDEYQGRHFIMADGSYDLSSINTHLDRFAIRFGIDLTSDELQVLDQGIAIYPTEFFCGFDVELWCPKITSNTYAVHYMDSSWHPFYLKFKLGLLHFIYLTLGEKRYTVFRKWYKRKNFNKKRI